MKPDPDGLEPPCCGGVTSFVMGFTHAFNEDVSPVPTSLVNSEGGRNYSSGAELGHRAAMLVGAIEIGLGGGAVGGAAYATVTTAGVAAPVAAEVAVGGSAAIAHGVSTIKNAERNLNSEGGTKTHQTYTKEPKNPAKDGVYSGKTSGTGTPEQNVAKRDKNHHMNDTHGRAKLDQTSKNSDAIRGREQQLIDANGGAKKQGGTSGNMNRGISEKNKNAQKYYDASNKEFN